MKHRYVQVGHNAWADENAGEEISKIIDREILERIINDFNPEIGVGNYRIKDIKSFFVKKNIEILDYSAIHRARLMSDFRDYNNKNLK